VLFAACSEAGWALSVFAGRRVRAFGDFQFGCERVGLPLKITRFVLGGGDRFDYDTEALIIASRKGYRIESVPITTVYTDQVSKIHPVADAVRFSN
jgi:hypothetical protein